jgi:hypothetical protein
MWEKNISPTTRASVGLWSFANLYFQPRNRDLGAARHDIGVIDRREVEFPPLDFFVREDAVEQDRRNVVEMRDVVEVPDGASRHLECVSPKAKSRSIRHGV